jgi:hypothetical protein
MNVFLDLEGTVIDTWHSGMLINSAQVREWLAAMSVKRVHIFSFAVTNDADQAWFWKNIAPSLRRALDIDIIDCPTVQDFQRADLMVTGVKWENTMEFITVRGKQDAFRSWCKLNYDSLHNILLDDTVPNLYMNWVDSNLIVECMNIDVLK